MSKDHINDYLVMWCNEGLETLINVSEKEQENLVSILKGEKVQHTNPINFMILRARYNPQRHYEIYLFKSEISEVSILKLFKKSPQVIVDAIRNVGVQLYSDRKTTEDFIT